MVYSTLPQSIFVWYGGDFPVLFIVFWREMSINVAIAHFSYFSFLLSFRNSDDAYTVVRASVCASQRLCLWYYTAHTTLHLSVPSLNSKTWTTRDTHRHHQLTPANKLAVIHDICHEIYHLSQLTHKYTWCIQHDTQLFEIHIHGVVPIISRTNHCAVFCSAAALSSDELMTSPTSKVPSIILNSMG